MTTASTQATIGTVVEPLDEDTDELTAVHVFDNSQAKAMKSISFVTVDGRKITIRKLKEVAFRPSDDPSEDDAYRVRCVPSGKKGTKTYWVSRSTANELVGHKLDKLNHDADAMG